jgi:hypothetical protein
MKRLIIAATLLFASAASAQKAKDPSAKLREVLPADVAQHVLATIADARSHSLPAAALERQALRLTSKGTKPADVEKSIDESADNMKKSKAALQKGGRKPTNDEVVAGSELIGRGVDGKKVSEFAKSAPSGRSLAVPLYVTGSLMDRGLKSDAALAKVHERLLAKATDKQLTADVTATASEHRPATVPAPAMRPAAPGRPATTPGKRG